MISPCWILASVVLSAGLDEARAAAFRSAVARVSPSVVRLDAVGASETVAGRPRGTGPTTGLVVASDGWIVSSSYNLAGSPAGILATLADGRRLPALVIAEDRSRRLTLLKVDAEGLAVPAAAPSSDRKVGQWAIAVGRALPTRQPTISVGIVSALERIWGKAVQTDAKVSPANYGGPLVDLEGRVIGVLVPLSPTSDSLAAGVEWYDAGIGFAVPFEHVAAILPRWKKGDLAPGLLGVRYESNDLWTGPVRIAETAWRSPAAKAGLKRGDRLATIDGRSIDRLADARRALAVKYAGDRVRVVVERKGSEIERELELVEELPQYRRAYLGIVLGGEGKQGVRVREVFAGSPAAGKLEVGDWITAVAGRPVVEEHAFAEAVACFAPGDPVELSLRRGEKTLDVGTTLAPFPVEVPGDVPARSAPAADAPPSPAAAALGLPKDTVLVAPARVGPEGLGIVFCLLPPGAVDGAALRKAWMQTCEQRAVLLVAIAPAGKEGWQPGELERLQTTWAAVLAKAPIDARRTAVLGAASSAGPAEAFLGTAQPRPRGLALLSAAPSPWPAARPDSALFALYVRGKNDPKAAAIASAMESLRADGHAALVAAIDVPSLSDPSTAAAIGRWMELLAVY